MAEKEETAWEKIKKSLMMKSQSKPEEDDPDPDESDDPDKEDDGDEYEDAGPVLKALNDKISNLENTIEVMAKATAAILDKFEKTETMQKSIGEGIVAIMDRTEEVLASPQPRKGAVSGIDALKKSMGSGGAPVGGLKPFTPEKMDFMKDILIKAVEAKEIDIVTCGKWETHMNKSIGKVAYSFPLDFVAFVKGKLGNQGV